MHISIQIVKIENLFHSIFVYLKKNFSHIAFVIHDVILVTYFLQMI